MDSHAVLRPGHALCGGDDAVGHHVQKSQCIEHRYRALHKLAVFAVGHQAAVVTVGGYVSHQAIFYYYVARLGRRVARAGGADDSDHTLFSDDVSYFVADGICLGAALSIASQILHAKAGWCGWWGVSASNTAASVSRGRWHLR
jgi:hypothetical protein